MHLIALNSLDVDAILMIHPYLDNAIFFESFEIKRIQVLFSELFAIGHQNDYTAGPSNKSNEM